MNVVFGNSGRLHLAFKSIHCHILPRLVVASPFLFPRLANFPSTFLQTQLHPSWPNQCSIFEIIPLQPVLKCRQDICKCCTPWGGVNLEAVFKVSAPRSWTDAFSPETEPPKLSSMFWMHCSWAAPSFWHIASRRIWFASGWLGICTRHGACWANGRTHHLHHTGCMKSPAMERCQHSLPDALSAVQLAAEIFSLGGCWDFTWPHRNDIQHEKLSRKIKVDWLDSFAAVLPSDINGFKSSVRTRVRVGTNLELLQSVFAQQKTERHRIWGVLATLTILWTQNIGLT